MRNRILKGPYAEFKGCRSTPTNSLECLSMPTDTLVLHSEIGLLCFNAVGGSGAKA